ncbi:MAG: hypothetical protein MI863_14750, partial [Desulfobacterales bacterium]|nr:hypothetical protein [Desulfobacterales bacterium]
SRGIEVIGETGSLEWRSLGKNPEDASIIWFDAGQNRKEILWEEKISCFDSMFENQLADVEKRQSSPELYGLRLDESIEALKIVESVR